MSRTSVAGRTPETKRAHAPEQTGSRRRRPGALPHASPASGIPVSSKHTVGALHGQPDQPQAITGSRRQPQAAADSHTTRTEAWTFSPPARGTYTPRFWSTRRPAPGSMYCPRPDRRHLGRMAAGASGRQDHVPRPRRDECEGRTDAAPDVVQASDCFHVCQNPPRRGGEVRRTHRACLPEPADDTEPDQPTSVQPGEATSVPPEAASVPPEATASTAVPAESEGLQATKRCEPLAALHELLSRGVEIFAIAEALGLERKTVRRYTTPPDPRTWPPPEADGATRASTHSCPTSTNGEMKAAPTTAQSRSTCSLRRPSRGPTPPAYPTRRAHATTPAASAPCAVTCRPFVPWETPKVSKQLDVRRTTQLITSHPDRLYQPDHLHRNAVLWLKQLLTHCPQVGGRHGVCGVLRPPGARAQRPRRRTRSRAARG